MTSSADRPAHVLAPGVAQETIHEMAAVIRTVFGVGLQASRQAQVAPEPTAAAVTAGPTSPAVAVTGAPVAPTAIPVQGIPVPGVAAVGIPVPGIPMPDMTVPDVAPAEADDVVPTIGLPEAEETGSGPAPSGVALPGIAVPQLVPGEDPAVDEFAVPAPIPLSLVPDLAPVEDIGTERRAALLQELAFLDD